MNTREFFIKQFKVERPKFVKVLRALPEGKLEYKPHERSSSAAKIAWFLVLELRALVDVLKTRVNHWQQPPAPGSAAAIADEYEKSAAAMEAALAGVDDKGWEETAKMFVGDRLIISRPLGDLMWDFFFDGIHHRGQLTTYIRPMGGKVPSIYGPSGDEN